MPRGYLKHQDREVGRKKGRGGASHAGAKVCCDSYDRKDPVKRHMGADVGGDFALKTVQQTKPADAAASSAEKETCGECPICFEDGPIVPLSNKCGWHDAACFKCLRYLYVENPKRCFPLVCFHPQCKQPVQWGQLNKHKVIRSSSESKEFHEKTKRAKQKEAIERMRVKIAQIVAQKKDACSIECPHCNHPRLLPKKHRRTERIWNCGTCAKEYLVSPDYATLAALERAEGRDSYGGHYGWARCPHCSILISKGDGCSHMICGYCKKDFDWHAAKGAPHALVPPEQIHLWW
ncbi:expressed unknown protein [Seminavis robusta]|uniref:RING-type domain-containing protein n=1 Tax=Seminavis robusta TaxID=568900 RepID=A0A9N8ENT1_9STRA|nr:expressed unknown protein [Seminavis robusta]|eukprot:Sro1546_g281400.1 n/a (292) ;mRNA; f:13451-14326